MRAPPPPTADNLSRVRRCPHCSKDIESYSDWRKNRHINEQCSARAPQPAAAAAAAAPAVSPAAAPAASPTAAAGPSSAGASSSVPVTDAVEVPDEEMHDSSPPASSSAASSPAAPGTDDAAESSVARGKKRAAPDAAETEEVRRTAPPRAPASSAAGPSAAPAPRVSHKETACVELIRAGLGAAAGGGGRQRRLRGEDAVPPLERLRALVQSVEASALVGGGDSALREAIKWCQPDGLDLILERVGTQQQLPSDNKGHTPLMLVAKQSDPQVKVAGVSNYLPPEVQVRMATRLIDHEPRDVDTPDCKGWTPLQTAAEFGAVELTRLLLNYGAADPNKADNDGQTALHWAVISSQYNVAGAPATIGDPGEANLMPIGKKCCVR